MISTVRVVLRRLVEADRAEVSAMALSPAVWSRIDASLAITPAEPMGFWCVESAGSFVGIGGLWPLGADVELAVYLVPTACHQGLAREASERLIAWAKMFGRERLVARTTADHRAAIACLMGLGFQQTIQQGAVLGFVREPAHETAR